jgi:hypothetical protein
MTSALIDLLPAPVPTPAPDVRDDLLVQVRSLVDVAATTDLDDEAAVGRLRTLAQRSTTDLVRLGALPGTLQVTPDDPPVAVLRLVGRASQHLSRRTAA